MAPDASASALVFANMPRAMLREMPRAAALQSLFTFIAFLAWDGDRFEAQIVLPDKIFSSGSGQSVHGGKSTRIRD